MKNKQKGFIVPVLIAIIAVLLVGGGLYVYENNKVDAPIITDSNLPDVVSNVPTSTNLVGNDRDAHGCIGSAGYTWCAVKNKCLRVWEEKCEIATTSPIYCTMDAKQCPDGSYIGRSGPNCEFVCPETKSQIFLENMNRDLKINKTIVPMSVYSYNGFGFGNGWVVQDTHSKYIQDMLPTSLGRYTSESGIGYSNGQIVCVIQGMRSFVTDSPPVTTHSELVCMDLK